MTAIMLITPSTSHCHHSLTAATHTHTCDRSDGRCGHKRTLLQDGGRTGLELRLFPLMYEVFLNLIVKQGHRQQCNDMGRSAKQTSSHQIEQYIRRIPNTTL